jgi:NADH dehydrogenase FAD-containing subunit
MAAGMIRPKIIIIGGGFGGLAAAKALGTASAEIILIDRTNHHLFQPLLYQVVTSVLAPSQISFPIRAILRKRMNTTVIRGAVTGVDKDGKRVFVSNGDRQNVAVNYDYLILATGASHSYFGRNEFERFAPGLKSLADAVATRNTVLNAFELAEAEEGPKPASRTADLCSCGRRPTGVERVLMLPGRRAQQQTSLSEEQPEPNQESGRPTRGFE